MSTEAFFTLSISGKAGEAKGCMTIILEIISLLEKRGVTITANDVNIVSGSKSTTKAVSGAETERLQDEARAALFSYFEGRALKEISKELGGTPPSSLSSYRTGSPLSEKTIVKFLTALGKKSPRPDEVIGKLRLLQENLQGK